MNRFLRLLKNKYVIFAVIMVVWIVFFDRYNLIRRYRDTMDLNELKRDRDYYMQHTEEVKKTTDELFSNQAKLEKFARERYYMKRDGEDVFIVEDPDNANKKEETAKP
jgi:cell division protein FtsB